MRWKYLSIGAILLLIFSSLCGTIAGQSSANDAGVLQLELHPPTPTPTPDPNAPPVGTATPAPALPGELRLRVHTTPTPTPDPNATPLPATPTPPPAIGGLWLSLMPLTPTPTPDPNATPTPDGAVAFAPSAPGELRLLVQHAPTPTPDPNATPLPATPTPTPAVGGLWLSLVPPTPTPTPDPAAPTPTPGSGIPGAQSVGTLLLTLGADPDDGVGPGDDDTAGPPAPSFLTVADELWLRLIPEALRPFRESLIAYWRLNEGAGTNAWDYSGNSHHGVVNGLTWANGGLEFGEGHVAAPAAGALPDAGTGLTVTAWCYFDEARQFQTLLGTVAAAQDKSSYALRVGGGQFSPVIWDAGEEPHVDSDGMVLSDSWTHLAVTWQTGGDMVSYVDGLEVSRVNASDRAVVSGANQFIIGAVPWNLSTALEHGRVAHVKVYHAALTSRAIDALIASDLYRLVEEPDSSFSDDMNDDREDIPAFQWPDFIVTQSLIERTDASLQAMVMAGTLTDAQRDAILQGVTNLDNRTFDTKVEFLEGLKLNIGSEWLNTFTWTQRWEFFNMMMQGAAITQKYLITEQGLKHLAEELQADVVERLEPLKDRLFVNEDDFWNAVTDALDGIDPENLLSQQIPSVPNSDRFATTSQDIFQILVHKLNALEDRDFPVRALMAQEGIGDDPPDPSEPDDGKEQQKAKVKQRLKQPVAKHVEVDHEFRITDRVIRTLKERGVSKDAIENVHGLKNQLFINEGHLMSALASEGVSMSSSDSSEIVEQAEVKDSFKVTEKALEKWKDIGIPDADLDKLKKLKGQVFQSSEGLSSATSSAVGRSIEEKTTKKMADQAVRKRGDTNTKIKSKMKRKRRS